MDKEYKERLDSHYIDFGNSAVSVEVTEYRAMPDGEPWLAVKVSTFSYGDHQSSITFNVQEGHFTDLARIGDLLKKTAESTRDKKRGSK